MNSTRFQLTILGLLLAWGAGCMPSTRVTKHPGPTDTGIRYYRPKPYLLIESCGKEETTGSAEKAKTTRTPSDEYVSISLDYLPDFSEEYSIKVRTGLGSADVGIKLEDGWNLTEINQKLDSQFDDNVKAVAELAKAASGFIPTARGGDLEADRKQRWVIRATNVPLGYYESVISTDACGAKRLQGWRYVGFVPFNSCPTNICGEISATCQDDNAAIFGLVFEDGAMVFRRLDQIRFIDKVERTLVDTGEVEIQRKTLYGALAEVELAARNHAVTATKKEAAASAGLKDGVVQLRIQISNLQDGDAEKVLEELYTEQTLIDAITALGGAYQSPNVTVVNLAPEPLPAPEDTPANEKKRSWEPSNAN